MNPADLTHDLERFDKTVMGKASPSLLPQSLKSLSQ